MTEKKKETDSVDEVMAEVDRLNAVAEAPGKEAPNTPIPISEEELERRVREIHALFDQEGKQFFAVADLGTRTMTSAHASPEFLYFHSSRIAAGAMEKAIAGKTAAEQDAPEEP